MSKTLRPSQTQTQLSKIVRDVENETVAGTTQSETCLLKQIVQKVWKSWGMGLRACPLPLQLLNSPVEWELASFMQHWILDNVLKHRYLLSC